MAPETRRVTAAVASADSELLRAALGYAAAGWPIIPLHWATEDGCSCNGPECHSPGKHPLTAHGLKDASRDELAIRRWYKQWPQANIGLPIPAAYVAVDVDGPEGERALADSAYTLPPTATARTGRGHHYVYRAPQNIPPKVGILNHVDLRGPGSYIVAPPSRHHTGPLYQWLSPLSQVADAPKWLYELLAARQTSAGQIRDKLDTASALAGVGEGQRDATLFRLASKLRYADVPYDTALELVLEAAGKCAPPFPERSAIEKVQSAYGRYQPTVSTDEQGYQVEVQGGETVRVLAASPQGPVELIFSDLEKGTHSLEANLRLRLLLPGTSPEPYVHHFNLLSLSAREGCRRELEAIYGKQAGWPMVLARSVAKASEAYLGIDRSVAAGDIPAPTALEFVVDDLVPADGVTVLFGAGSSGKTYLGLHLLVAVARGERFLGRATMKRNGLWIDYETGAATWGYRLERVCAAQGITRADVPGIRYWWADGIPLSDLVPSLQPVIQRYNVGFIGLDHAALACGGEPEKAESALRFFRWANRLRLPILTLAHITGDGERDPALVLRPFGSVFWSNGARRTWFVQRQQEKESSKAALALFCRKVNDGMPPADIGLNLFFNDPGGPVQAVAGDLRETPEFDPTRGAPAVLYDHPGCQAWMTYIDAAEATGIKVDTVKRAVSRRPEMFERAETGTSASGGAGLVVHFRSRKGDRKTGTENRDTLREKDCPGSGSGGLLRTPENLDMQNRDNRDCPGFAPDEDSLDEVPF